MPVNDSDRKIVDTRAPYGNESYRLTDVPVIGVQPVPPQTTEPLPGQDPTVSPGDIGNVRNIALDSQSVRIQPDGSATVDVVLSFEPASGASKHEIRITKL